MDSLLAICRPGFEKECVAALADACARRGFSGTGHAADGSGFACFGLPHRDARELLADIRLDELIFARDLYATSGPVAVRPPDRLAALRTTFSMIPSFAECALGAPDTNEGRELAALCRSLEKPFAAALDKSGIRRDPASPWRTLLLLLNGQTAMLALGRCDAAPLWPLGVPRLKLLREAPSRSALKLEEAWHLFIPRDEWERRLGAGRSVVDLGAAPGGWTWLMARRGMRVEAVDNGELAPALRDDPGVTHRRADGFHFAPRRPVDWLVCDMVEKPSRITTLIARWLVGGLAREAIFNLKLPMKQRYAEAKKCLDALAAELDRAGLSATIRARQLYHDREEITVHARVTGRRR